MRHRTMEATLTVMVNRTSPAARRALGSTKAAGHKNQSADRMNQHQGPGQGNRLWRQGLVKPDEQRQAGNHQHIAQALGHIHQPISFLVCREACSPLRPCTGPPP